MGRQGFVHIVVHIFEGLEAPGATHNRGAGLLWGQGETTKLFRNEVFGGSFRMIRIQYASILPETQINSARNRGW